jgi:REP element-mobilizing transposase RayT
MGRSAYKIYETVYPYFMTSSFVNGLPLFADPDAAQIVLDSLLFLQSKREVTLYAYVLMENHFHIIARADELSENMRHFKSYTAREIIDLFEQKKRTRLQKQLRYAKLGYKADSSYQLWQEGLHPQQISNDEMMCQKMEYIHQNPVKRGYVDHPEDWRYSSARNYLGMKGLIPVTIYRR